jgi:hypothetical protein
MKKFEAIAKKEILEAKRKELKRQNELIGKRIKGKVLPDQIDLDTALARFVYIVDGLRVADLQSPAWDTTFTEFKQQFCSSVERSIEARNNKEIVAINQVSDLWLKNPQRKTVHSRTFKAGDEMFIDDPEGKPCLNYWAGFPEFPEINDAQYAESKSQIFFDHVEFLFGEQTDTFLDWLAHIQQKPHELPHFGWLHVATQTGMGRNWVASVLTRLWAGSVAPSLDLVGTLKSGFNGELSKKVLAIVDEIHEGGSGKQWEHAEKIKEMITQEKRWLNPKFGRKSLEFNSCRWLIFSNHLSAIPLEKNDRRFAVKTIEYPPKEPEYYEALYEVLDDEHFLAAVAKRLSERDISSFNPGKSPETTDDKRALIEQNMTDEDYWCELLVRHWDSDLISNADYALLLNGHEDGKPPHKHIANRYGIKSHPRPMKINGKPQRFKIIRNHRQWMNAYPSQLSKALVSLSPMESPRERIERNVNKNEQDSF